MTTATLAPPEKRAASAAKRIATLTPKVAEARKTRNDAAAHLRRNEGWEPVDVYTLIGVSRGIFARIMDEYPERPAPVADAEKVAKRAAKDFAKHKAALEEAREVRTEAVVEMLARNDSNADVARASKLTSARIAQMRKGGR